MNYTVILDEQILGANRGVLDSFGKFFGKKIFYLKPANVDAKYDEKIEKGENVFMRPVTFVSIVGIEVQSVHLIVIEGSSEYMVQLNGNPELRFPIGSPRHEKPSFDTVQLAIRNAAEGKEIIYFADGESLLKEIESINSARCRFLEAFANECLKGAQTIQEIMMITTSSMRQYSEQMKGIELPKAGADLRLNIINA